MEKSKGVNANYYLAKTKGDVILSKFYAHLKLFDDDMWDEPEIPETDYSAKF